LAKPPIEGAVVTDVNTILALGGGAGIRKAWQCVTFNSAAGATLSWVSNQEGFIVLAHCHSASSGALLTRSASLTPNILQATSNFNASDVIAYFGPPSSSTSLLFLSYKIKIGDVIYLTSGAASRTSGSFYIEAL
jgi:hypothetical protein